MNNVALGRPATASRSLASQPPAYAVDGSSSTAWNSGDYASQWIEVDTQAPYLISRIRLTVAQLPAGYTDHYVFGRGPNPGDPFVLLHRFTGFTSSGQVLEYTPQSPFANVRSIRVWTFASPSWVSWLEIEAFSTCTDIEGATEPTFTPGSGEVGSSVRVVVSASNVGGSTPAASALTGIVSAQPPPSPPVRCRVPRVIGLRLAPAKARIRRAHCSVGRIRRAKSSRVGRVIRQSPRPGTRLRRGGRVNLVVGRR